MLTMSVYCLPTGCFGVKCHAYLQLCYVVCLPCQSTAYQQVVLGSNAMHICNCAMWYAYHVSLLLTNRLFWGQMPCISAIVLCGMHTMSVYCLPTGCFGVKCHAYLQLCYVVCIPCQ